MYIMKSFVKYMAVGLVAQGHDKDWGMTSFWLSYVLLFLANTLGQCACCAAVHFLACFAEYFNQPAAVDCPC